MCDGLWCDDFIEQPTLESGTNRRAQDGRIGMPMASNTNWPGKTSTNGHCAEALGNSFAWNENRCNFLNCPVCEKYGSSYRFESHNNTIIINTDTHVCIFELGGFI